MYNPNYPLLTPLQIIADIIADTVYDGTPGDTLNNVYNQLTPRLYDAIPQIRRTDTQINQWYQTHQLPDIAASVAHSHLLHPFIPTPLNPGDEQYKSFTDMMQDQLKRSVLITAKRPPAKNIHISALHLLTDMLYRVKHLCSDPVAYRLTYEHARSPQQNWAHPTAPNIPYKTAYHALGDRRAHDAMQDWVFNNH